jgi:hypothetical protein
VDSTVACNDPPLRNWLFDHFFGWGREASLIIASEELKLSYLANIYTLYFDNSSANQSFGPNGKNTASVK